MCGRKLAVHPAGNVIRRPTDGADCHVSSIPPVLGETLGCQAIKSQVGRHHWIAKICDYRVIGIFYLYQVFSFTDRTAWVFTCMERL